MPLPRIHCDLIVTGATVSQITSLVNFVSLRLATAAKSDVGARSDIDEDGRTHVLAQARFSLVADADVEFSQLQAQMSTNARILTGSRVSFHLCPHDDLPNALYNCRSAAVAQYREIVK